MVTKSDEHQLTFDRPTHRPTTVDPEIEHAIQALLYATGHPVLARCVPVGGRTRTHKTPLSRTHAYHLAGNPPTRKEITNAIVAGLKYEPPTDPADKAPPFYGADADDDDTALYYARMTVTNQIHRPTEDDALTNVMWERDPLIAMWEELLELAN